MSQEQIPNTSSQGVLKELNRSWQIFYYKGSRYLNPYPEIPDLSLHDLEALFLNYVWVESDYHEQFEDVKELDTDVFLITVKESDNEWLVQAYEYDAPCDNDYIFIFLSKRAFSKKDVKKVVQKLYSKLKVHQEEEDVEAIERAVKAVVELLTTMSRS